MRRKTRFKVSCWESPWQAWVPVNKGAVPSTASRAIRPLKKNASTPHYVASSCKGGTLCTMIESLPSMESYCSLRCISALGRKANQSATLLMIPSNTLPLRVSHSHGHVYSNLYVCGRRLLVGTDVRVERARTYWLFCSRFWEAALPLAGLGCLYSLNLLNNFFSLQHHISCSLLTPLLFNNHCISYHRSNSNTLLKHFLSIHQPHHRQQDACRSERPLRPRWPVVHCHRQHSNSYA